MTRYIYSLIPISKIILLGLICFNCLGKKSTDYTPDFVPDIIIELSDQVIGSIGSIPDWYTDIPVEEGFRYQVGIAIENDKQTVAGYAEYNALNNLEEELKVEMHSELNHALNQIGKNENSFIGKALKRAGNKIISRHVNVRSTRVV